MSAQTKINKLVNLIIKMNNHLLKHKHVLIMFKNNRYLLINDIVKVNLVSNKLYVNRLVFDSKLDLNENINESFQECEVCIGNIVKIYFLSFNSIFDTSPPKVIGAVGDIESLNDILIEHYNKIEILIKELYNVKLLYDLEENNVVRIYQIYDNIGYRIINFYNNLELPEKLLMFDVMDVVECGDR